MTSTSSSSVSQTPTNFEAVLADSGEETQQEEHTEQTARLGADEAKPEVFRWWDAGPVVEKVDENVGVPKQPEVFRWWEGSTGESTVKWKTLVHNGVLFPPPYKPLPSHVKMKYDGQDLDLPPAAEEVAGFYAALIESDYAQDDKFNENFFRDWQTVLEKYPARDSIEVVDFLLCDFRPIFEYFETEKAEKKVLSAQEKKDMKTTIADLELKYTTCLLNGREEKVGNFRVEPPGLFRGRAEHSKRGSLKYRVEPKDVTINIGKDAPIPVPNVPGTWKEIIHDNTVAWLATWTENVNSNHRYVFLTASSSLKAHSDMLKFEQARDLKAMVQEHIDRIRTTYEVDLKSTVVADRQRATAMYFIDKLGLRVGREERDADADTVGCCSLRCVHVRLEAPNFVVFDVLGEDSIRYYNRVPVAPRVFENIRTFKENKSDEDRLFDCIKTAELNEHLQTEMKGLTATVFRTFNASSTLQRLLDENDLKTATIQEKLNAYNKASREVAVLCNHRRVAPTPKTHAQPTEQNTLRSLKYDRMKLRHTLFNVDKKFRETKEYMDDESDMDDEWIDSHEEAMRTRDIKKAEGLAEDGDKDSIFQAEYAALVKEHGADADFESGKPEKILQETIRKLDEEIKAHKLQIIDRNEMLEIALNTSKINYLDPRITIAWCTIRDVPVEKVFSQSLRLKCMLCLRV
ncbi:hypothetical protein C8F04DRAFT_1134472 [Mycena alexandri]|uniref:DNA topoisomerase 1 n=1 Tax=Mycena alexandri TaxID=1745969 RepID=A0AAD6S919_9AGAR|nr:hypothetical protein C8F04DRAFT_1134472 [Mycena alexandri]